jgi:DNA (cytosine-5)-methyltransferase 1
VRLLDLFCCQGGAAEGYRRAGFTDIVGVDIVMQPRYPFQFVLHDALDYLRRHAHEFDAIHASPPCQKFTNAQKIMRREHPDLIAPVRELLDELGKLYVIENVPAAPLLDPVELCGAMFPGLATYRHRLFETNWPLTAPAHPEHRFKTTKMGRPPRPGEFMHVVGNFSGVTRARAAMGIDWMSRDGLREAIPPAYTEFIGQQLLAHIKEKGIAA